jgi:hypothetical protein
VNEFTRRYDMFFSVRRVLFASCIWLVANGAWADDEWKARFLTEAPQGWQALEEFVGHSEGTYLLTSGYTSKPLEQRQYDFMISGQSLKASAIFRKRQRVLARNPDYFFRIERPEQSSGAYAIMNLEPSEGGNAAIKEASDELVNQFVDCVYACCCLLGTPLSRLIKEPQFEVKNVILETRNGKQLVRVDFIEGEYAILKKLPASHMFLDPENYWCVKQFLITREIGPVEATLEYGDKVDGFPVVRKRTKLSTSTKKGKIFHKSILEVQRFARSSASESEFRLSAYGISEPDLDALRSGGSRK